MSWALQDFLVDGVLRKCDFLKEEINNFKTSQAN